MHQRARLGLKAGIFDWMSMMVQLQDVRRWGEETNTLSDYSADGFDVHQAWAEVRCPVHGIFARVGRQEISLDNQRLIGAVGWSDQGRSFDSVLVGHTLFDALHLRAFYAKLGEADAFAEQTDGNGVTSVVRGTAADVDLAGFWARLTRFDWLRPSLVVLYDRVGALNMDRGTLGLYLDGATSVGLSYSAEGYLQVGQLGGVVDKDILAFMFAGRVSYTAKQVAFKPSISVWFEYLSGDRDAADDTVKSFDTLFATNHKFYGYMDLFSNIPVHTGGLGLMDAGGRLKVGPVQNVFSAWFDWHHLRLAREHASGASTLGNEFDLTLDVRINRHLGIQGVFAAFLPDSAIPALGRGGDDTELFGYLQTDLSF